MLRLARTTHLVVSWLLLSSTAGACANGEGAPPRSAAYVQLYESLDRPAALRTDGDSAFIVTEMEVRRRPLTPEERKVAARVIARTVERNWPDPRLTHVTVIFQRARRLGPFILGVREHRVRVVLRAKHEAARVGADAIIITREATESTHTPGSVTARKRGKVADVQSNATTTQQPRIIVTAIAWR